MSYLDFTLSIIISVLTSVLAAYSLLSKDDLISVIAAGLSLTFFSLTYLHLGLFGAFLIQLAVAISILVVLGLLSSTLRQRPTGRSNVYVIILFMILAALLALISLKISASYRPLTLQFSRSPTIFALLVLHGFLIVVIIIGLKKFFKVMNP
ncbi:MAG: hypothetical protein J7J99_04590 [Thermoprotei archaeon]|nr:hypothetical protein [Thermoprotei archaeon]